MQMDELQNYYNGEGRGCQAAAETRFRLDCYLAWIGTGKKVLDVGCNDGSDALRIIEAGNTVEGIDISFNAVEQACKRGVSARVLDISSQPLPFPAESFDVVVPACQERQSVQGNGLGAISGQCVADQNPT